MTEKILVLFFAYLKLWCMQGVCPYDFKFYCDIFILPAVFLAFIFHTVLINIHPFLVYPKFFFCD